MKPEDFKEYQEIAVRCKKYSEIPYTKVKSLLYTKDEPKVIRYNILPSHVPAICTYIYCIINE